MNKNVNPLIDGFIAAIAKPFTPLETLTVYLEAALDCARDTSRSEQDRMRELRLRISLMPVDEI
jgi:hypothetical protein